ncbi:MAG: hypothetical protein KJZ78_09655 [Bryobacteraceae bacterium]|nr:hypothetical protein [Bryobacteraceae bacterium]
MKGCAQASVFPGCTLHYQTEKLSLLARILTLEFLARDAGETHHAQPGAHVARRRLIVAHLRA